jgi:hypothetical protein
MQKGLKHDEKLYYEVWKLLEFSFSKKEIFEVDLMNTATLLEAGSAALPPLRPALPPSVGSPDQFQPFRSC